MKLISKFPFNPLINNQLNELKWSLNTLNANSKFNKNNENTTNFSNDFIFDEENSYLKLGGFVLNYTINNTSDELQKSLNNFINSNTAAVIGDFTVYNYERKCFCSVVIINQIYDIGISTINIKIYINNRNLYKNRGFEVRLFFELLFVVSYIFYVIFYFRKIYFVVKTKIEKIKIKQERKLEDDKNNIMRRESSSFLVPVIKGYRNIIKKSKIVKKKKKTYKNYYTKENNNSLSNIYQ
jgi:hypothetical protein